MFKKYGFPGMGLLFSLVLAMFLPGLPIFAQDRTATSEDLWICPGAEIAMYSLSNAAYGGGLALGYGKGAAIGFKAAWFADGSGEVTTLELGLLLRLYFQGSSSGPFIQVNGGPAFFAEEDENFAIPSRIGVVSAGLSLGWRFPLARYWFVDGALRVGYPYIAGLGLSAGFRY